MRRPPLAALAALAVGLLAGAARAQEPLTSPRWRPPPKQACRPSLEPRALPAASALVDSAGLLGILAGAGDSAGYAVLSAQYATDGSLARLALVESDLSVERSGAVATAVATLAEPQRPTGAPWSVRLRVRLGASPAVRVERSEFCPAVALPESRSDQAFRQLLEESQVSPINGEALVLRSIDETGAVIVADVLDVAGTPRVLQDLAPGVLRADVFMPPLLDRRPAIQVDTVVFSIYYTVEGKLPEGQPTQGQPNKLWRYRVRLARPR